VFFRHVNKEVKGHISILTMVYMKFSTNQFVINLCHFPYLNGVNKEATKTHQTEKAKLATTQDQKEKTNKLSNRN
jgi:hypothetical protein